MEAETETELKDKTRGQSDVEWFEATADKTEHLLQTHKLPFSFIYQLISHINNNQINCRVLARLKQLTSSDTFVITDPELTRGVDYRAATGTLGIALLVMSSSQSERAYVQLLGRVGRYKEPCLRFVWSELDSEDVIDCYEQAREETPLRHPPTISRAQA